MTDTVFHHVVFHIATVCPEYRGVGIPPIRYHIPVSVVSLALVADDIIIDSKTIESLDQEADLVEFFFEELVDSPHLVSFRGQGFSLPIMLYRAIAHGINASSYLSANYQLGGNSAAIHTDLYEELTFYGAANTGGGLADYLQLVGLPTRKPSGHLVASQFASGDLDTLRGNLATNVMETTLLFLRVLLTKGAITREVFSEKAKSIMKCAHDHNDVTREHLRAIDKNVLKSFILL